MRDRDQYVARTERYTELAEQNAGFPKGHTYALLAQAFATIATVAPALVEAPLVVDDRGELALRPCGVTSTVDPDGTVWSMAGPCNVLFRDHIGRPHYFVRPADARIVGRSRRAGLIDGVEATTKEQPE